MAKLDNFTLGNWQVFRKNLTGAVIPYYTQVANAFPDSSKGVGKVVKEQRERVSRMLGLLARMEGRGITPISRKELKNLDKLNVEFLKVHTQVLKWVQDSIPLRKGSEKAIKDLVISPKDMRASSAVSKPSRGGELAGLAAILGRRKLALGGAGLLGSFTPVLGPLAGPAMIAGGLGYAGWRVGKGTLGMLSRRRDQGGGKIAPPATAAAAMPGIAGTGIAEGLASGYPRDERGRFTSRKGLGLDSIEQGLFKFFNKRAMKARWTKRLLRAVETGDSSKKRIGGGLFGAFGKLKGILVGGGLLAAFGKFGAILGGGVLTSMLAVAGLAASLAFTGVQLFKVGSAAKELQETHKAVAEHNRKMLKKQIGFLDKISLGAATRMQVEMKSGDEPSRKAAMEELMTVEREKVVIGTKLEKQKQGFFGGLYRDWKAGATATIEKPIPGFDLGGVITKPTLGVIAEKQPEVVTPLAAGNVMDVLKAIMNNTAKDGGGSTPAPIDTFSPPFDLADPLLNRLNTVGSLE